MMNSPDALPPSDSDSDSTEFSAETRAAAPTPALLAHPLAPALPAHSPTPELMPVQDGAWDESNRDLSDEERRLTLLAETVGFTKAWRSAGYVVISRRTVEEETQIPVTLRHEEITMTRFFRDPNLPEAAQTTPEAEALSPEFGAGYGEGTVVMRLHEEVAEVVKTVRVAEEVEFARRIVSEETKLLGSARREELDVKNPQNLPVLTPDFPLS